MSTHQKWTTHSNLPFYVLGLALFYLLGAPYPSLSANEPIQSIEAKEYSLTVVNRNASNTLYLLAIQNPTIQVGQVLLLKKKETPVMAFRILKTYPEQGWVAAKRIKKYPGYPFLEDGTSFKAVEKTGNSIPASPSAQSTGLAGLTRSNDQNEIRHLETKQQMNIQAYDPDLDQKSTEYDPQLDKSKFYYDPGLDQKNFTLYDPSLDQKNLATYDPIVDKKNLTSYDPNLDKKNLSSYDPEADRLFLKYDPELDEKTLEYDPKVDQKNPPLYDPELDSSPPTTPISEPPSALPPSPSTRPEGIHAEPLQLQPTENPSSEFPPEESELGEFTLDEAKDPDPQWHWLSVGFGYIRNHAPPSVSGYFEFTGGNLRYGLDISKNLLLKHSSIRDSFTLEGGVYLYKTLNFNIQSDSYTVLSGFGALRYTVFFNHHLGVFGYLGLLKNSVVAASNGTHATLLKLTNFLPAIGIGGLFQIGPGWYTRVDLGFESVSLNLVLRF